MSLVHTSPTHVPVIDPPCHPVAEPVVAGKKKKKKRRHDDTTDAQDSGAGVQPKKKKKRREKHSDGQFILENPSSAVMEPTDAPPEKRKKSKKRDKGEQPETTQPIQPPPQQIDPNLTLLSEADSSTAALLSAIVAAAASLPDPSGVGHMGMGHPFHPNPQMILDPSQDYMSYSFMPYGFGGQPDLPTTSMQIPNHFPPPPTSASLTELAFASNEDVLRALQALDMSKITSVLKGLGEVTCTLDDQPAMTQSRPLKKVPVASGEVLALSEQNVSRHSRTLDMPLPATDCNSREHAYLLANKWLNANKLSELVKTEGLVYKKGKFSAIEEQQLSTAIENYRIARGLTDEDMQELIYPQAGNNKDNAFWSEFTAAVPQRPIIAVYHHVRRVYHPLKQQGKWSSSEDALLKQAVTDLGQQWEKVSKRVGRMSSDCRDRYRNHIQGREIRVTGHWTEEEEAELTRIVTDMTINQGRDIDNDVFWGRVSELMGGKRGRQQCRIKWTDALSKTIKNDGLKPRWSQQDAYILVHKVDSLNVWDDTEIDWKMIPDPQWNLWSAHTLQRRWLTMKRGIKGYEDMTHQELMDILRVKKAQIPTPLHIIPRKRKERKVSSAAAIMDESSFNLGEEAGSSNGPGMIESVKDSGDDNIADL